MNNNENDLKSLIKVYKQTQEALQQQIEQQRLIIAIAVRIRQSLRLNEVLDTTVAEVRQFLHADRVFIYRFEPDYSGSVVVESVGHDWMAVLNVQVEDAYFMETRGEKYRQGGFQAVADIYTENLTECHRDLLAQFQVKANLAVPILQGEKLWGLLVTNQCATSRQWQSWEIDLLQQLATQVGIAIQQSQLYEQVRAELKERKQAEQKIREQAALLNVATDAILVRDFHHQILFWNQGAERLYGWTSDEAIGKKTDELLYKENLSQQELAHQNLMEHGVWQGELNKVTKSGQEIIVESRWTLMRDELGQPKSILTVETDITEKKQMQAQFLRAQRLESLGTLASGIAHDLNNILTPIICSIQMLALKSNALDARYQQTLKILEDNSKRAADLVKQILTFARGNERRGVTLEIEPLLLELEQTLNSTFPKSIKISKHLPTQKLWTIKADPTQIHQVLMNLCVNARDAMPDGGNLSISAANLLIDQNFARMNLDAQVGPHVVITISDTGFGIAPLILERIFEPFFTTKDSIQGTGLGLSTVIGIVKNHGGFVSVHSEMGKGSQFQVFLPSVENTNKQPAEDFSLPVGQGESILVVDDEAAIIEITKTSLEDYNYKVLTASNGIEAIALYAQHKQKISLVLMDMMMPLLDGLTALRILQEMNPKVKIIAISGIARDNQLVETANAGVNVFLRKPYTIYDLTHAIHNVLSESKQ